MQFAVFPRFSREATRRQGSNQFSSRLIKQRVTHRKPIACAATNSSRMLQMFCIVLLAPLPAWSNHRSDQVLAKLGVSNSMAYCLSLTAHLPLQTPIVIVIGSTISVSKPLARPFGSSLWVAFAATFLSLASLLCGVYSPSPPSRVQDR